MFKVKICGITTPDDALLAASLGADAVGLNFYDKSPRYLTPEQASDVSAAIWPNKQEDPRLRVVGVFVNSTLDEQAKSGVVRTISDFQHHGDESPSTIATLSKASRVLAEGLSKGASLEWFKERMFQDLPKTPDSEWKAMIIRAFRPKSNSLSFVADYLRECAAQGSLPSAVLLDAHAPGSYGGTGIRLDWNMVRDQRDKLLGLPLILAGGLTPDNVAQAILTARPDAVDVASGVESSPGKKDPAKLRDFIAAAKEAFSKL